MSTIYLSLNASVFFKCIFMGAKRDAVWIFILDLGLVFRLCIVKSETGLGASGGELVSPSLSGVL